MLALEAFERFWKIPSWIPLRWVQTSVDQWYYDVFAALEDLIQVYWGDQHKELKLLPEGSIIVIPPNGGKIEIYDYRDYLENPLQAVETIVVAGLGSSRVGAIAFGRTVAEALKKPVASLITGYGLRDMFGDLGSSLFILVPTNWILQAHWLLELLDASHFRWLGQKTYQFSYAIPAAATLHQLLLHHPGHFKTIIGHSKGNFTVAAALYALKFSLDQVNNATVLEGEFGLSDKQGIVGQTATRDKIDIFTFGCFVPLPGAYGQAQNHVYRSHQYVGNVDLLGFFSSSPRKMGYMYLKVIMWLINEYYLGKGGLKKPRITDISSDLGNPSPDPEIADERIVATWAIDPHYPGITAHNLVTSNYFHPFYYFHMPIEKILEWYKQQKGI